MKDLFLLNPDITYLNFGSFGACPAPIFKQYQALQLELEREPVQFITQKGLEKLNHARWVLGQYIGCQAEDLTFMPNPSYAINTIAKSLKLHPHDEILSTNLEYGAMERTWNYYTQKANARFVQQEIDLPIRSKEAFLENFWRGYSAHTKAIFISQITSATGLILPVKELCDEAKKRGLLTIVDGAHVPGHIPLNLQELKADIYTGACHKWMMAPKGASFLYVNKENQEWVDPLVISWGYQSAQPSPSQFIDYHQTAGTRDFSAFLTLPFCLDFMAEHHWPSKAADCQAMTINQAKKLQSLLNFQPICPIDSNFIGQMYSIPIETSAPEKLQRHLFQHYKIEIPVTINKDRNFIRFSVQVFNNQTELDYLTQTLIQLKKENCLQFT